MSKAIVRTNKKKDFQLILRESDLKRPADFRIEALDKRRKGNTLENDKPFKLNKILFSNI